MDLIILIVFVALAMLVPNIKAAKKQQQAAMPEDTPDDAAAAASDNGNALEPLLRQLSGQSGNRSAAADNNPNNRQTHGHNRKKHNKAKSRIDNRSTTSAASDDRLPHRNSPIGSIDKTAEENDGDATAPIGRGNDGAKGLSEEFNLRDAVLYSEILKPKFDNND